MSLARAQTWTAQSQVQCTYHDATVPVRCLSQFFSCMCIHSEPGMVYETFWSSFLNWRCNQMVMMDVVNLFHLLMYFTIVILLDGLFCLYQVVRFLIAIHSYVFHDWGKCYNYKI